MAVALKPFQEAELAFPPSHKGVQPQPHLSLALLMSLRRSKYVF